jgi:hypothetical protein
MFITVELELLATITLTLLTSGFCIPITVSLGKPPIPPTSNCPVGN